MLGEHEDRKGRARHEKGGSVPGKVGERLSGTNSPQVLEFLLVPDVVELVHEGRAPSVQLDAFHVVNDLVDQPTPGVLVLHLILLQVLHNPGNKTLQGHHDDHNHDAGHHGPADKIV